jgi:hypothetical protein
MITITRKKTNMELRVGYYPYAPATRLSALAAAQTTARQRLLQHKRNQVRRGIVTFPQLAFRVASGRSGRSPSTKSAPLIAYRCLVERLSKTVLRRIGTH